MAPTKTAPRSVATTRPSPVEPASTGVIRRTLVAGGLFGVAAVHLVDLPDKMAEVPYLGWAYIGLIIASLVLAEFVALRPDKRLMGAAAALSASVILGFVVNRTVGMPNAMEDIGNWGEPLGMISLLIEAAVVWLGIRAWMAED